MDQLSTIQCYHFFQNREFVPRSTRRNRRSCWWTWMWSWGVTTVHLLYSSTELCSKRYLYNHLIIKRFLLLSEDLWEKKPDWYWKGLNTLLMISSELESLCFMGILIKVLWVHVSKRRYWYHRLMIFLRKKLSIYEIISSSQ